MRRDVGARPKHVVLVGGGHAHVQLLRAWTMSPLSDVTLTVVVDEPVAVYSGMVPALVAGEIQRHELEIDIRPLARAAGAACLIAKLEHIDSERRILTLKDRPPLRYDVASINIGSTTAGRDTPGVTEHAVASRPIRQLVDRVEQVVANAQRAGTTKLVVVGAGAAGVELVCCAEARLRQAGCRVQATLVGKADAPLSGQRRLSATVMAALARRGIAYRGGSPVVSVEADGVSLADGGRLDADVTLWVAGAAPHGVARASGLSVDARGFFLVDAQLQVLGAPGLFAAGDCAVMDGCRWVPRAGVYAVRAGPVLRHNIEAELTGGSRRDYTPQRDFLQMLNLGDQTAIAAKWGQTVVGRWVWRWKDRIDRRFMVRFQRLAPDGAPLGQVASMGAEDKDPMFCGGCAAKVDAARLTAALDGLEEPTGERVSVGLSDRDDVAVVAYGDGEVVVSVDAFPAFTDDPWLVGRAAVRNATSDLYAKGARPRHAMAWVTAPRHAGARGVLGEALQGIQAALREEGVALVGGHTTVGEELVVGLTIMGDPPHHGGLWTQTGARPGDALILTRALGTGVLWRADAMGLAAGPWMDQATRHMLRRQDLVVDALRSHDIHAATDVTGFGLAGHAATLATASDVTLRLWADRLPVLPGVLGLLERGVRSTAHDGNASRIDVRAEPVLTPAQHGLFYDPQTCGGLLLAVPAERVGPVMSSLTPVAPEAAIVGEVVSADTWRVELLPTGGGAFG